MEKQKEITLNKKRGKKDPVHITEKKPFPSRLRRLMNTNGTTQAALAEAIGMTRQAVSLYTNGQNTPDIEVFMKIADFFGVSYDYLLGYSETQQRENYNISEETGLSEEAIIKLKNWHEREIVEAGNGMQYEVLENKKAPEELSKIIKSNRFGELIKYIRWLKYINPLGSDEEGFQIQAKTTPGAAKVKAIQLELGINATREYIMFLISNTFRDIIEEIIPFVSEAVEYRKATQADINDFFGR